MSAIDVSQGAGANRIPTSNILSVGVLSPSRTGADGPSEFERFKPPRVGNPEIEPPIARQQRIRQLHLPQMGRCCPPPERSSTRKTGGITSVEIHVDDPQHGRGYPFCPFHCLPLHPVGTVLHGGGLTSPVDIQQEPTGRFFVQRIDFPVRRIDACNPQIGLQPGIQPDSLEAENVLPVPEIEEKTDGSPASDAAIILSIESNPFLTRISALFFPISATPVQPVQ